MRACVFSLSLSLEEFFFLLGGQGKMATNEGAHFYSTTQKRGRKKHKVRDIKKQREREREREKKEAKKKYTKRTLPSCSLFS